MCVEADAIGLARLGRKEACKPQYDVLSLAFRHADSSCNVSYNLVVGGVISQNTVLERHGLALLSHPWRSGRSALYEWCVIRPELPTRDLAPAMPQKSGLRSAPPSLASGGLIDL
jgi:hypothetical protein